MTTDMLHPPTVARAADVLQDRTDEPTPVGKLLFPVLPEVLARGLIRSAMSAGRTRSPPPGTAPTRSTSPGRSRRPR
jgi:hypothetical protein